MSKSAEGEGSGVNRIKTGIEGLDRILYGGIPEKTQNLIMGPVGSGKSLIAFNILYNNARNGMPCTFVTVDQTKEDMIRNIKSAFPGLTDIDELISSRRLHVAEARADDKFYTRENAMLFIAGIIKAAKENNSSMLVLDSISIMRALFDDDRAFTRMVNSIAENLRIIGLTSIITVEVPEKDDSDKVPGLYEQSMFDWIFRVNNVVNNDTTKHFGKVVKLRYSSYSSAESQVQITEKGITVSEISTGKNRKD
jgi:circadian clock protein KaiC